MNRNHDTLVILGSHPDTRNEFDWGRAKACDVWVFNEAVSIGKWVQHASAVFQMHIPAIWRNPANRNDSKHADWLTGGDTPPVYMQEKYGDVPQAIEYPLTLVMDALLPGFKVPLSKAWNNRGGFFTSSLDFAMALGIYMDYPRIEIYGCEMGLNTEYVYQRPGFTFWTGLALGRGIVVDYHGSIFDMPLYGYEGDIVLPRKVFDDRIMELRRLAQESTLTYNARKTDLIAKVQELIEHKCKTDDVYPYISQAIIGAQMYAMLDGALQENERYIKRIETMVGASGDFRISRTEFEQARHNYMQKREQSRMQSDAQSMVVQRALAELEKADGYKKRTAAADEFIRQFDIQITLASQAAGYDKAGAENIRYMRLLDEKYRAAGGQKSVEVLENLN